MNIDQSIANKNSVTKRGEMLDPAQKVKLEKAVREFQSVFVGYMLKSMRSTVEKADNSTDSFGGDMLESMFDVELSKHISKNSNLGMADMLYQKLTGERLSNAKFAPSGMRSSDGQTELPKAPPVLAKGIDEVKAKSLDDRLRSFDSYVAEASQKFGVSDSLIKAVIATESSARPNAQSSKNAKGLMQLIDSTADDLGVKNVWDPRENILGGAKYLKQLLEQFDGDVKLAVASYNAGPSAVQKYRGIPPYKETKEYVSRVMNFFQLFEQQVNDLVEENHNE